MESNSKSDLPEPQSNFVFIKKLVLNVNRDVNISPQPKDGYPHLNKIKGIISGWVRKLLTGHTN